MRHPVRFYADDNELYETVAQFLRPTGATDESVMIVIATAPHRIAIESRLSRQRDTDQNSAKGTIQFLDAQETLNQFMVDAMPDPSLFTPLLVDILGKNATGAGAHPVRIYGEMVDLLWRQGNPKAALRLEEMWADLQRRYSFSLLCTYLMGSFYKSAEGIEHICAAHTHVFSPIDPVSATETIGLELPRASSLKRHVEILNAEIEQRQEVERELRDALIDLRRAYDERDKSAARTERLTRITGAIAVAVTPQQVFEAVVDQVADAVGASSAGLWIVDEKQNTAALVHAKGYRDEAKRSLSVPLNAAARFPVLDVIATGRPIWIASQGALVASYPHLAGMVTAGRSYQVAALPILSQHKTLGVLGLTFENAAVMQDDQKDFLLVIVRYCGQALERLRLLDAEQRSRVEAELLYGLAGAVNRAQDLNQVFSATLDAIEKVLGTKRLSILTYDSDGVMRFNAWRGLSDTYRSAVEGHSPWARDVRSPEPVLVPDVEKDTGLAPYLPLLRSEGIAALAFIPVVAEQRLMGKFMVYYDHPHILSGQDLEMAGAVANHVGAALVRFAAASALQQSVRFGEVFSGILGHDLRNPLSAILMGARRLGTHGLSESLNKTVTRMVSSGERMARMIDQLLDFTHVRVGTGIPLLPKTSDLRLLTQQAMDELRDVYPSWNLNLESDGNTSGVWDPDRLLQVFSNLLGNAVQHGDPRHGVQVRIDGTTEAAVRIEVQNMGRVPAALLPTIFDPMTRGNTGQTESRGLGLGLFITQKIVRAHGGRISLQSTTDHGTTFTLVIPRICPDNQGLQMSPA